MKLTFKEEFPSGNDVLIAEDISVGYGKPLVENLSFLIRRGERVAFSGANGVGKTTLLKVLTDQMSIISGHLKVGHNVSFGYYDQGQLLLNEQNTVIEEVHQDFRLYTEGEIRNLLARFLFRGDDVFLKVSSLSGGEKARLSLLKLMMGGANVLVLDEPTNHLDIDSKEAFEDAILEYPGTVIVVSHDRYFLKKIPQRIINLDEYRHVIDTDGTKQKNDVRINSGVTSLQQDGDEMTESAIRRTKRKERQAEERRNRREKQRLEEFIKQHEASIHANEKEMCKPDNLSDFELLAELAAKNDKLKNELERAYEKWIEFE